MIHSEGASGASLEQIIDGLEAIVVVVDREGRTRLFNRAAERASGYEREEVIGRPLIDVLVRADEQTRVRAAQDRLLAAPSRLRLESHWVTKTDETRLIRWSAASLKGAHDEPMGVVGTGIDITRYRALQREVIDTDERLRQRFGQELHDMLASHLAGVAMLTAALARKVGKGETARVDELRNLTGLLYDAMEQVRVLSQSFVSFDLQARDLAAALYRLAEHTEMATGVRVACSVSDAARSRLPGAQTATHLYRIAQEAAHNAVKHGKPSQVSLSLRLEARAPDETALVLAIRDDGRGLPEAFESGVGMKSMRRRARLIGASLRMARAEEGGTVVECVLPLSGQDS